MSLMKWENLNFMKFIFIGLKRKKQLWEEARTVSWETWAFVSELHLVSLETMTSEFDFLRFYVQNEVKVTFNSVHPWFGQKG